MLWKHTIGILIAAQRLRSRFRKNSFQEEREDAGRAIKKSPERWAIYLFETRRYLLKHFPFVIVYRIATDRIEIVAIAHGKRKPGFWRKRMSSE